MMHERELAYQAYINEETPNGNTRLYNIVLCNCGDKAPEHIATQVELAFHAGWHAALAAVRADYAPSILTAPKDQS